METPALLIQVLKWPKRLRFLGHEKHPLAVGHIGHDVDDILSGIGHLLFQGLKRCVAVGDQHQFGPSLRRQSRRA
jgi:hypothetical protein